MEKEKITFSSCIECEWCNKKQNCRIAKSITPTYGIPTWCPLKLNKPDVVRLLPDNILQQIAESLFEQSACLVYCVPMPFCGSFHSKDDCIECYKLILRQ